MENYEKSQENWTDEDWEQYLKEMKDYFDNLEEFVRITKIKQLQNGFDENWQKSQDIL